MILLYPEILRLSMTYVVKYMCFCGIAEKTGSIHPTKREQTKPVCIIQLFKSSPEAPCVLLQIPPER